MNTYEASFALSEQRLKDNGFKTLALAELDMPEVQQADNFDKTEVNYVSVGPEDAPHVILHATPMFTRVEPHFALRLMAQQKALGDEYRILGVEGYVPEPGAFDNAEKAQMRKGILAPIAARLLIAAEAANVTSEQKVYAYGYSLGADTAVQLTHDVLTDENRGVVNLQGVGAIEPARVIKRSPAKLFLGDFNASGKELYENVTASEVPALIEAFGADVEDPNKKAFDAVIAKGVLRYIRAGVKQNLAIVKGLSTDVTTRQLHTIIEQSDMPVLIGRQKRSKITPASVLEELDTKHPDRTRLHFIHENGDHSADDNIRKSAARILFFAGLAK